MIGKTVRPKAKFEYVYGQNFMCYIEFSQQQKWRIVDWEDAKRTVTLTNDKGIVIELSTVKFWDVWELVEKGKKK